MGLDVLLLEDQPALAEALARILESRDEIATVVVALDARQARLKLLEREFDAALVDVRLGDCDGIEFVKDLVVTHPDVPALVLTAYADPNIGADAIRVGAAGFMSKDTSVDELMAGLTTVAEGGCWFSPTLLAAILRVLRHRWEMADRLQLLSSREHDVLELMVEGRNRAEMAEVLFLSVNTVRSHVRSVLRKLEVHSSLEAVSVARRAGVRPGACGPFQHGMAGKN